MLGRAYEPPKVVATSVLATALPTSRSTRTMAPSTPPAGPLTVPTMLASPGPSASRVLDVVVGFRVVDVVVGREVVAGAAVVVGVVVVWATPVVSGPAEGLPSLQAAASSASRTAARRRTLRAPAAGPRPGPARSRRPTPRQPPPAARRPGARRPGRRWRRGRART